MLALLSDIHANLPALEAVLAQARTLGCTRYLSLGDVVGYGAQPRECIDRLRELGACNIMGNHDHYLVSEENCTRSKVVAATIERQKAMVGVEQLDWLRASAPLLREGSMLFVHGGPEDPRDQYLYALRASNIPVGIECLFSGHTHVQALIEFETGQRYCNPGSVGQPRDGDPRAAFATLATDGRITLHRVPYDIDGAVRAMNAAGFEPFQYQNLYVGAQIGGRIDHIKVLAEKDEELP